LIGKEIVMSRPLRVEFAGALYHVTARGNARAAIYLTDEDRIEFLTLLTDTVARHDWYCHAYCLMDNHYHLLIETTRPTLSKGMKFLNGTYTQSFNRTHTREGHLFQGRYKAILVQKDTYLLELARYIVLNPVRARMVHEPEQWPWSSYRAMVGAAPTPECLSTDWVLGGFAQTRQAAQLGYIRFIQAGKGLPSPWEQLKNQIFLGDDAFVEDMQCKIDPEQSLLDIPKKQKLAPIKPLHWYEEHYPSRAESMAAAYLSGHYTLTQVGDHFSVSYATVSRAAKSKVSVKCKT
jgi:putative transposase